MNHRSLLGLALGILFLLVFILILAMGVAAGEVASPITSSVGGALWRGRTFEVILQGIMILSAVMSIILLLGPGRSQGGHS